MDDHLQKACSDQGRAGANRPGTPRHEREAQSRPAPDRNAGVRRLPIRQGLLGPNTTCPIRAGKLQIFT